VEDEPPLQAPLFRILKMLGYPEDTILCAADIAQAKSIVGRHELAMVLVDLRLPDGDGSELISWLRSTSSSLPILVISAWSVEEVIFGALRAGANGYLLKERDDLEIAISIKNVAKGGAPIDPFIAQRILSLVSESNAGETPSQPDALEALPSGLLSKRELVILTRVAEGMSNREIAEALNVSRWTVDTHIRHIYSKLSVNSRTQAVRAARLRGLFR
jgi:DNA-binding NarL/FixJ family response regulator